MNNIIVKSGLFGARVIRGDKSFAVFIISNGLIILGLTALGGLYVAIGYATLVILFMFLSLYVSKRYGK